MNALTARPLGRPLGDLARWILRVRAWTYLGSAAVTLSLAPVGGVRSLAIGFLLLLAAIPGFAWRRPDALGPTLALDAAVALGLWWLLGPDAGVEFLLLFVVATAGVLLDRRWATILAGAAMSSQAAQLILHRVALTTPLPLFHAEPERISEAAFIAGVVVRVALIPVAAVVFTAIGEAVRRSHEDVERSEHRFRSLFEGIPVAMYRSTPDGRILDANPALLDLLGFDDLESLLTLDTHDAYVDTAERRRWAETIEQRGVVVGFEERLTRADGRPIWVRDSARVVHGDDGSVAYFEGALVDITDEIEAKETSRRLIEVVEATPDIVILMDTTGEITWTNQAGRRYWGVPDDAPLPRNMVFDLLSDGSVDRFWSEVVPTILDAGQWRGELTVRRPDGGTMPASTVAVAHRNEEGEPVRFSAIVHDITDRKQAERELADLVRAKDEFVASVSHELRTPLTAVVGLAQELRDTFSAFSQDEARDLIKMIADQSLEVAGIVEDLLVAARADIGTVTVVPHLTDLHVQARAALASVQHGDKDIEIAGGSLMAWADPSRVRQIVRNLVTNAIRYGGERIVVRTRREGRTVVVEVADDGPGIPPDQRDAVFEPYRRAHDRPTQPASVGLGLTVSRRLARLMDGDLRYRYDGGESVFELVLPSEPPRAVAG